MAFNDEGVEQRLSGLNQTQDSIESTAQWLIFHRRHAERIVQLWMKRMQDPSSSKRLNLIYLANDVAQKSKSRSRDEFCSAFGPVMPEAITLAYKAAPQNIRGKVVHVVSVWRERNIFDPAAQTAIETRIQELDRIRNGTQAAVFGTTGGDNIPQKLQTLIASVQAVEAQTSSAQAATTSATQGYDKLMDPSNPYLAPPVFAARLNGLLNTLALSQTTLSGFVKSRRELVAELETLLAASKAELDEDEKKLNQLEQRKAEIETRKHNVEMEIMRGLGPADDASEGAAHTNADGVTASSATAAVGTGNDDEYLRSPTEMTQDLEAPEMEALTPTSTRDELEPVPEMEQLDDSARGGFEPARKRRRMDSADGDGFPDLGLDDGIDADVAAMLENK